MKEVMQSAGSCLCGSIVFTVDKVMPVIGHCHCTMCRKFHGAAFSTFAEVKLSNLHWVKGETLLKEYRADNGTVRKFCENCGSSLLFESQFNRDELTIEIALAAFDNDVSVYPNAHIYTESKVSWFNINDSLPQFTKYRR